MKVSMATSLAALAALELAAGAPTTASPHVPGDCIAEQTTRWYRKPTADMEHKIPVQHHRDHEHEAMLKRGIFSSETPNKGGLSIGERLGARKGAGLTAGASAGRDGIRVGVGRERPVEKRGRKTKALKHGKRPGARPKPKVAQSQEKAKPGAVQPREKLLQPENKSGEYMKPEEKPKKWPAVDRRGCKSKASKHRKPAAKPKAKAQPKPQPQAEEKAQPQDPAKAEPQGKPGEFEDGFVEKSCESAVESVSEKAAEEAVKKEQGKWKGGAGWPRGQK